MNLPDAVPVSSATALELARRHGLSVDRAWPLPSSGIINTVISLDDRFVLRVPRNHPAHVEQAHVEAQAIPLAVVAGVKTPGLVAFDASLDVLPVPYLIVDQVRGIDLESSQHNPSANRELWNEVGRDLARLHDLVSPTAWPREATPDVAGPSETALLVQQRVDDGWFSYLDASWLLAWIEKLATNVGDVTHPRATHGDVQMSNILAANDGDYAALLDWGCASCKDPVIDFMPMPLAAVPFVLEGHREVAALPDDETAERRILLGRVRTLLKVLPRGAAPRMSWGERPTAWLTDLLRFFQHPPSDTWRELAPD